MEPVIDGAAASMPRPRMEALRDAAQALEAAFLAEMLTHARVGEAPEAFGGGAGEAQFGSVLRRQYAERMAEAGGIGLAQQIFDALVRAEAG